MMKKIFFVGLSCILQITASSGFLKLDLQISGSGSMYLKNVDCENFFADINTSGSGEIFFNILKYLDGSSKKTSSSSPVRYKVSGSDFKTINAQIHTETVQCFFKSSGSGSFNGEISTNSFEIETIQNSGSKIVNVAVLNNNINFSIKTIQSSGSGSIEFKGGTFDTKKLGDLQQSGSSNISFKENVNSDESFNDTKIRLSGSGRVYCNDKELYRRVDINHLYIEKVKARTA